MLNAAEIAGAGPRPGALVLGTSDLTKDLNARETRDRLPLMTALGLVLLAARAHRCAVLDGVQLDLADAEGFAAACRQARGLGVGGKTLTHPGPSVPGNAAFAPSADEIARARRLVAAYSEGVNAGKGAIRHEGRLVEALHVETARRTLALAEASAARESGAV